MKEAEKLSEFQVELVDRQDGVGDEDVEVLYDMTTNEHLSAVVHRPGYVKPVVIPVFLFTLEREFIQTLLPLFVEHFTQSKSILGLVGAAYGIGTFISNMPAGSINSFYGSRYTYIVSLSFELIAAVICLFTKTVWGLFTSRLLSGIAMTFNQVSTRTLVIELLPENMRGRVFSLFGFIRRLCSLVTPLIVGVVMQHSSVRVVFVIQIVLCIAAMACGLVYIKGSFGKNGPRDDAPKIGNPCVEGKRFYKACKNHTRNLLRLSSYGFFLLMLREARMLVVPVVVHHMGFSPENVGFCVGLGFGLDLVAVPIGGFLQDRYGRKVIACASPAVLAIGFLSLAFANLLTPGDKATYIALCFIAAFLGVGNGLSCGIVSTLCVDLAAMDPAQQSYLIASYIMLVDTSFIASPAIVGPMVEYSSVFTCILLAVFSVLTVVLGYLYVHWKHIE